MSSPAFLPFSDFEPLANSLAQRLTDRANSLAPAEFSHLLDPALTGSFLDTIHHLEAHEGTIWILQPDIECLVPVFNHGSNPDFLKVVKQPLSKGIISVVFHTQIGFCENEVHKHAIHDNTVDRQNNSVTTSMAAVPFYFANEVRGIFSAVKLRPASAPADQDPPPFTPESLQRLNNSACLIGSALDAKLIRSLFGLR